MARWADCLTFPLIKWSCIVYTFDLQCESESESKARVDCNRSSVAFIFSQNNSKKQQKKKLQKLKQTKDWRGSGSVYPICVVYIREFWIWTGYRHRSKFITPPTKKKKKRPSRASHLSEALVALLLKQKINNIILLELSLNLYQDCDSFKIEILIGNTGRGMGSSSSSSSATSSSSLHLAADKATESMASY